MVTQPEKATLPVYGTPKHLFEELNLDPILSGVTDQHGSRVQSAVDQEFKVFPRSTGLYTVESVKDGAVDSTYIVNMKSDPVCSCMDFNIRCTGQNMSCKHIWRVRLLIRLDALPRSKDKSFSWMTTELQKDLRWLDEKDADDRYVQAIDQIQQDLDEKGHTYADYKDYMVQRADILTSAEIDSI